jgi:hypothetical protein
MSFEFRVPSTVVFLALGTPWLNRLVFELIFSRWKNHIPLEIDMFKSVPKVNPDMPFASICFSSLSSAATALCPGERWSIRTISWATCPIANGRFAENSWFCCRFFGSWYPHSPHIPINIIRYGWQMCPSMESTSLADRPLGCKVATGGTRWRLLVDNPIVGLPHFGPYPDGWATGYLWTSSWPIPPNSYHFLAIFNRFSLYPII